MALSAKWPGLRGWTVSPLARARLVNTHGPRPGETASSHAPHSREAVGSCPTSSPICTSSPLSGTLFLTPPVVSLLASFARLEELLD